MRCKSSKCLHSHATIVHACSNAFADDERADANTQLSIVTASVNALSVGLSWWGEFNIALVSPQIQVARHELGGLFG